MTVVNRDVEEAREVAHEFRKRAIELELEAQTEGGDIRLSKLSLAREYERRADMLDPPQSIDEGTPGSS